MAEAIDRSAEPAKANTAVSWAGTIAGAIWIFGGAIYFLIHFTSVFYAAHESSIDAAVSGLGEMLGLDRF